MHISFSSKNKLIHEYGTILKPTDVKSFVFFNRIHLFSLTCFQNIQIN